MADKFDKTWPRLLRVAGLVITLYEVFIYEMQHPMVLLLTGPMMGIASLLKQGAEE